MPNQQQSRGNPIQDYVTVAERIERFYERYPEGRIITHIVEHDAERGFILMRAEGYRASDDMMPSATGHAFELRSEGYVNRTSYIENCESSCVGRMLAMLGFEVRRGIASREEMDKASRMQHERPFSTTSRPGAQAAGRVDHLATDEQKQDILILLEGLRPGDRRGQQRLLVELSGKESRDDLTSAEAVSLISKLKKSANGHTIEPTRDVVKDPAEIAEWGCDKAKRGTIIRLRANLKERYGWTDASLLRELREMEGLDIVADDSQLNNEQAGTWILHLSQVLNKAAKGASA